MNISEQFWFWLGWALGNDQVEPEHAIMVTKELRELLDNPTTTPEEFARYAAGFLCEANEGRTEVLLTARKVAVWHS